jgi:hypothetical protein
MPCSLPPRIQSKAAVSCVYLVLTGRGVKLILALVSRSNAISRQAAIRDLRASYEMMNMGAGKSKNRLDALQKSCVALAFAILCAACASAQDANGPLAPPPEHDVHRVTTTQPAEAPPVLPPAEIIKEFAAKEEKFLRARIQYGYKKSIKLTEFGRDGQPSGEYQLAVQMVLDSDGRPYEKIVDQKQSTLRAMTLTPDNVKIIGRLPSYPLIPQQLAKYDLRYVGTEKVDEIDCYIIDAKPKLLERAQALFQGVVWVDKQYLEVVKTYGKWVTDLGDEHAPELPFTNFETYRENVEGKYWFPNYARSDEYLHSKDSGDIPVRLVIKWTEFKPLVASAAPASAAVDAAKPKP